MGVDSFEVGTVESLRAFVESRATVERFRAEATDFSRQRSLPFATTAVLAIRGHKQSLATTLIKVFGDAPEVASMPTPSALCQARQKLKPELFLALARLTAEQFYQRAEPEGFVRRWRGRRLLAADGTTLNLPDTPQTRARYSVHTNQHESGTCVQALAVVLYDVLNDIGLELSLGPYDGEPRRVIEMRSAVAAGDVLTLDRHFLGFELLATFAHADVPVVIRCQRAGFAAVRAFWASEAMEQEIDLQPHAQLKKALAGIDLPEAVRVRLVKVVLESGEIEVLATTLRAEEASREELGELYGLRWGVETFFARLKNIYDVERIGGTTLATIEQNIYGVFFLATLEGVLTRRAAHELDEASRARGRARPMQVNRASSYVALIDRAVDLLTGPERAEVVVTRLHELFTANPGLKRPGRTFPRAKLKHSRRLRHHRFRKRLLA